MKKGQEKTETFTFINLGSFICELIEYSNFIQANINNYSLVVLPLVEQVHPLTRLITFYIYVPNLFDSTGCFHAYFLLPIMHKIMKVSKHFLPFLLQ